MKRRRHRPSPGHALGFMPPPGDIARMLQNVLVFQHDDLPEGVAGPCWHFPGTKDKDGYGGIKLNGKKHRVHRVAFAVFHNDSAGENHVDHLCRHRSCINPAHLIAKEPGQHMSESGKRRWIGRPVEPDDCSAPF